MEDKITHQIAREIERLEQEIEPQLHRLSTLKEVFQKLQGDSPQKSSPLNGTKKPISKKSKKNVVFADMTKPKAAIVILKRCQKPMNTWEIMQEMLKGGMAITGKTERERKSNVYTGLRSCSVVEKLPGGYWVLPDWDEAKKKIKT